MEDISNQSAVANGNARLDSVRQLNERIREHNTDVADQIQNAREQEKTANTISQAQQVAMATWKGSKMPDAVKAYKDYKAKTAGAKQGSNPTSDLENSTKPDTSATIEDAQTPAQSVTEPPAEPVAEGSTTGASISEDVEATGSKLVDGMPSGAKQALTEAGESKLGKIAGAGGEVAGTLMSAAAGGMDVYNDFKGGLHLAGNNWEEKAGNVLQIGGSIADIVGTFYPPAKLIGGALDLASGAINEVGEQLDTTDADKLKQEQTSETVQEVTAPSVTSEASAGIQ